MASLAAPVRLGSSTFAGASVSVAAAPAARQVLRTPITMKKIEGKVVSTKMQNTVIIQVIEKVSHPIYGKKMNRTSRYVAHDEMDCGEGDIVEISDCLPMSKTKRHAVSKVLTKAPVI
mmetsp:Transcript_64785/g.204564  ORF Transcript_64785/g.204564 Transcript_64785/m.204564 type:complete len:118 (-) Transcript_64785:810-1163(-)|eukprot:CAMPEP_0182912562 /NCGR_PEP_ID=MMETSP0034_2-20130328/37579_1 /TAXON_ID=156128 /ORGANISM="Nephroselmis pyriformis, Strain CCMP717" /LENGTH=117 /DNA_ID=CAMNT_0025049237 /DNA_START=30 /DNA_END=383 /DNA_ORIENTATION=+